MKNLEDYFEDKCEICKCNKDECIWKRYKTDRYKMRKCDDKRIDLLKAEKLYFERYGEKYSESNR